MDVITAYRSLTYNLEKFGEIKQYLLTKIYKYKQMNIFFIVPQFLTMAALKICLRCKAQYRWSTKVSADYYPCIRQAFKVIDIYVFHRQHLLHSHMYLADGHSSTKRTNVLCEANANNADQGINVC